jgi:hypothetical protein
MFFVNIGLQLPNYLRLGAKVGPAKPGRSVAHGHDLRRILDSVTFLCVFLQGTAAAVRCLTCREASDELYWTK